MAQSVWVFVPGSGIKAVRDGAPVDELVDEWPDLIYFYADLVTSGPSSLRSEVKRLCDQALQGKMALESWVNVASLLTVLEATDDNN